MLSRSMEHVLTLPFASPNAFFLAETETEEGRETIVLSRRITGRSPTRSSTERALAPRHWRGSIRVSLARTSRRRSRNAPSRAFPVRRSSSFRRLSDMTRLIFQASQRKFPGLARPASPRDNRRGVTRGLGAGVTLGSQRSASSRSAAMTTAANRWLEALTPEQSAGDLPERYRGEGRWNFIPTNMFPRKGVPWKEMSDPQRKLARTSQSRPQPEGLRDGHLDHGARDHPACDRELGWQEGRERPRPRALLLHDLRRALSQEHLGLAGRGPSRVVAFHDRQRHGGRQHAGILRYQSGKCASTGRRRACAFSARWKMRRAR